MEVVKAASVAVMLKVTVQDGEELPREQKVGEKLALTPVAGKPEMPKPVPLKLTKPEVLLLFRVTVMVVLTGPPPLTATNLAGLAAKEKPGVSGRAQLGVNWTKFDETPFETQAV